ncbi:YdeI/OmpD-associated family protein [Brachybacterium subflavum]|uniref:YdeI/OmpD-associated family protein n=1 Tax=Brachybacterium subflavum TaxID=2585206 RepID=UPI0012667970|nr:YdeI/OmpD-associated family protein [Brachybacterium subflavum]
MAKSTASAAEPIEGTARIRSIGERLILPLPAETSARLRTRGQNAVTAVLDGHPFDLVVEPDGAKGHWIALDAEMLEVLGRGDGEEVSFTLTPSAAWPEPAVPEDLGEALAGAEDVGEVWEDITPMARWEWVRWVGATKNPATRARRVEVSLDKMRNGKRRPCCFDLASCTDPEVSTSGKLLGLE